MSTGEFWDRYSVRRVSLNDLAALGLIRVESYSHMVDVYVLDEEGLQALCSAWMLGSPTVGEE
jgi:hypothetical protein